MSIVDRILAVSDIHGENQKFLQLLKEVEYDAERDLLVVCGDLLDRGRENIATIRTCQQLQRQGAIILKGNHERFAQDCLPYIIEQEPSEKIQYWVHCNGGSNTYDEFLELPDIERKKLLAFFKGLPTHFVIGKYIFCHAGLNARQPLEKNTEDDFIWANESFYYCPAYADKIVVFGHLPTCQLHGYSSKNEQKFKIWFDKTYKDKIGIDCGSVFGGKLAALELPSGREFYL